MSTPREKFQELLRELFQFDCADLDFGIYRIMNQKRGLIERFIEKDLLDAVAAEFVRNEKLADGADDVFVNADGVVPGARVLDPLFKERMFAPVNA